MNKKSKVILLPCSSYREEIVYENLEIGLELLGGIEKIVKKEESILLKPNLLKKAEVDKAVITHPSVVGMFARLMREKGYQDLSLADSCGNGTTTRVIHGTGIDRYLEKYGIPAIDYSKGIRVEYPEGIQAKEFIATLVSIKPLPGLHLTTTREQHWPDKTGWTQLIELATKTIAEGELDKVVLARATDLHFASPVNAAAMMAASRRLNLNCYHFYMAFDGENAFLGSSPERLWRRRDKALRTEALAGTVANNPDDKQAQQLGEWLMADDKNQRENMLVVEDISQRLQADTQTLDVLPPQVLRLRKVQHLRRCIWTSLNKADDVICLHQLQPTAAVAGLPRDLARQFIARHEPFTREWYAGSAGYLSLQQSEFCVSLRSAKISGNVVRLYAGAGIVRGSDPEQEWQEIDNKAAGLRTLLQME